MIRCNIQRHINLFITPSIQWQHYVVFFFGVDAWPSTLIIWWGYWGIGFYWQPNESEGKQ